MPNYFDLYLPLVVLISCAGGEIALFTGSKGTLGTPRRQVFFPEEVLASTRTLTPIASVFLLFAAKERSQDGCRMYKNARDFTQQFIPAAPHENINMTINRMPVFCIWFGHAGTRPHRPAVVACANTLCLRDSASDLARTKREKG